MNNKKKIRGYFFPTICLYIISIIHRILHPLNPKINRNTWITLNHAIFPSENRFCYMRLETSNAVEATHRTKSPRFHGVTLFGTLVELTAPVFWSVGQSLVVTNGQITAKVCSMHCIFFEIWNKMFKHRTKSPRFTVLWFTVFGKTNLWLYQRKTMINLCSLTCFTALSNPSCLTLFCLVHIIIARWSIKPIFTFESKMHCCSTTIWF